MAGDYCSFEKELLGAIQNGSIKLALNLMKEWKLSDSSAPNFLVKVLHSFYLQFESVTRDQCLLKPTVDVILSIHRSLSQSAKYKNVIFAYKILCCFFSKCAMMGHYKESMLLLKCCIMDIEGNENVADDNSSQSLLEAYNKVLAGLWNLSNKLMQSPSHHHTSDISQSHILRLRLLSLVFAAKSKISPSKFLEMFDRVLGNHTCTDVVNENGFATIEDTIFSFLYRPDVSFLHPLKLATTYSTWIISTGGIKQNESLFKRIGCFFFELVSKINSLKTDHLKDRSFCIEAIEALILVNVQTAINQKKSPVEHFLTTPERIYDKENILHYTHGSFSDLLIGYVLDLTSQNKVFCLDHKFNNVLDYITTDLAEKYLSRLTSLYGSTSSTDKERRDIIYLLADFSLEICQEKSDSRPSLLLIIDKVLRLQTTVLSDQLQPDPHSKENGTITIKYLSQWRRKLKTCNKILCEQADFEEDMRVDVSRMVSLVSSASFFATYSNLLPLIVECYKIGKGQYGAGNYKSSIYWFQCCIKLYKSTEVSSTDVPKFKIWPCYEYMGDCQRRLNMRQEAYESIREGVLMDHSFIAQAAARWLRITSDVYSSGQQPQFLTMASAMKGKLRDHSLLNSEMILMAEFKALKETKTSLPAYHEAVLNQLLTLFARNTLKKCTFLLQKAKLMRSTHKDGLKGSIKLCQEVINLLKTSHSEDMCAAEDLKAQALVLSFVCSEPENNDELNLVERLQAAETMKSDEDNIDSNEVVVVGDGGTLNSGISEDLESQPELHGSSHVSLQALEDALDLWHNMFSNSENKSPDCMKNLTSPDATLESIEILAHLLKLHQHPRQLKAFQLLHYLSTVQKDVSRMLWSISHVVDYFMDVRQTEAAHQVILQFEMVLSGFTSEISEKDNIAFLLLILNKCHVLFAKDCIDEAAQSLMEVSKLSRTLDKNTIESLLMKYYVYLIVSKLSTASSNNNNITEALSSVTFLDDSSLKTKNYATQLEWLIKATKCLSTLVYHLFENLYFKVHDKPYLKWLVVDNLIQSLLLTARCFMRCGIAREAKSYLLQAMAFSQSFHLTKRLCEIKFELACLAYSSGMEIDSKYHLSSMQFLLVSHVSSGDKVSDGRTCTNGNVKQSSKKCAKISSNVTEGQEKSPIKTPGSYRFCYKPLTLKLNEDDATLMSPEKNSQDRCKPPSCWGDVFLDPELCPKSRTVRSNQDRARKKRVDNVKCKFCEDLIIRRLQLWSMVADCEQRLKAGRSFEYVSDFLDKVHIWMKNLSIWARRMLDDSKRESYSKEVYNLNTLDEEVFSGEEVFSDIFNKVQSLKVTVALSKNDPASLESMASKSISSLRNTDLVQSLAVETILLKLVSKVDWPDRSSCYMSEGNLLRESSGRAMLDTQQESSLTNQKPDDFAPSPTKRVNECPSMPNAPVKKGRRPKPLKLQMPLSEKKTPSSSRRRLPPRLQDIDPTIAEGFERLLITVSTDTTEKTCLKDSLKQLQDFLKQDPPITLYRDVCHSMALLSLDDSSESSDSKAAYCFSEALSISLRHATLINISKKIRNVESSSDSELHDNNSYSPDIIRIAETQRRYVDFKMSEEWSEMFNLLPEDWVVCQMNLVSLPGKDRNQLFITRMSKTASPIVIPLPYMTYSKRQHLLEQWNWLMQENLNTMKVTDKKGWWERRKKLNEEIEEWMETIEKEWFSGFVGCLFGKLLNHEDEEALKKGVNAFLKSCPIVSPKQKRMVEMLLNGSHLLDCRSIIQALACIAGPQPVGHCTLKKYVPLIQSISKTLNLQLANRGPVILILDKDIQHLPFENMPGLEKQTFTRQLSLRCMIGQLSGFLENSVLKSGVERDNAFYVVNPDNNLPNTQATFQNWFENREPGWEGVIGRAPTSDELSKNLMIKDLFIYFGHGTGGKYLSGYDLEKLTCRSVAMLMGCSSGRLWSNGHFEPSGMLIHYFLAGSPCVLANLWDVTDRDIDRFMEFLLKNWLNSHTPSSTNPDFLNIVIGSRSACTFKYLIGAAPVVYGFPVSLKKSIKK